MSDLINKRDLLVYLRNWQYEQFTRIGNEKEYNLLERLIHGIENEPTVSDKEIRDRAIEEFAEKIKSFVDCGHLCSPTELRWTDLSVCKMIDEIAEQMKEVGE